MTALYNQNDLDKKASGLFKEKIDLIRGILDAFPEGQGNEQAKRYAMDKLDSLELVVESVF